MKIVDLSHTISPDMPAYPGTEQPIFKIGRTIENDGFLEKEITLYSHTGTHIDAPAHLIKGLKICKRSRGMRQWDQIQARSGMQLLK